MSLALATDAGESPPVCADPIAVRCASSQSIDEHVRQLQGWDLRYDQIDCGRFEGRFTDIRLPGLQLFAETTTRRIRQRGTLLPDSCGIGAMLQGRGALSINGVQTGTGTLLMCNGTELDICTPPDCTVAGVVVDADELQSAVESMADMGLRLEPDTLLAMTSPEAALAPWRGMLLSAIEVAVERPECLRDGAARQRMRDDLLLTLIDAMAGAYRDDGLLRIDSRKRVVDRACELVLARPDEPPSLFEVCRRVGASPRKLGYCFQDTLGVSPGRYLKAMRLNAARRDLGRDDGPNVSVYEVAARWGFWHFGHFSADYKKLFAELPSETLRRARARQEH
ncbi:MAG TPA: helix-turn-helix domain-containing protein [Burkholderiaceae bacterium]|nr:helix-turn-helix domain-containing protein [Burkholderiaceae bacterium]